MTQYIPSTQIDLDTMSRLSLPDVYRAKYQSQIEHTAAVELCLYLARRTIQPIREAIERYKQGKGDYAEIIGMIDQAIPQYRAAVQQYDLLSQMSRYEVDIILHNALTKLRGLL